MDFPFMLLGTFFWLCGGGVYFAESRILLLGISTAFSQCYFLCVDIRVTANWG